MKLIIGLGNPGEHYKHNRHNVGFMAIDFLLSFDGFMTAAYSHEFKSDIFSWKNQNNEKILFVKPQTYMNDSGQALKVICNFYKLDFGKDLLIIHDEVDLPFGTIRLTASSSAAGHNGVQSIIDNLGTQDFNRIRIGVETRATRQEMPTDAFVLQNFNDEELAKLHTEILPEVETKIKNFINSK